MVSVCVLALVLWPVRSSQSDPGAERGAETGRYSVLQMNVCLSGLAGCYDPATYRADVDAAVRTILVEDSEWVSLNEACSGDAADIARRTGYHVRFTPVDYGGAPLRCVRPGGRGLFGNAVLAEAPIVSARDGVYDAQSGLEERRWICATDARDVTACSTHLSTRDGPAGVRANDAQCAEVAALLAELAEQRPTILAGDLNRLQACAPDGFRAASDDEATQVPGIQHVYATSAFAPLRSTVVPATTTDHDYLRVSLRFASPGRR